MDDIFSILQRPSHRHNFMGLSLLYRYDNDECPNEHPLDPSVETVAGRSRHVTSTKSNHIHLHRISNLRRKFHIKGRALRSCLPELNT